MKEFNIDRFNEAKIKMGEKPIELKNISYKENSYIGTKGDIETKNILDIILQEGCLDYSPRPYYEDIYSDALYDEKNKIITLKEGKEIVLAPKDKVILKDNKIVVHSPAHTLSVNNKFQCSYDLSKNESPILTLRPIAIKSSIAEIIWIYFMKSNDLVEFDELLGKNTWEENHKINNWWNDWALRDEKGNYKLNKKGHPYIGCTYGETIRIRDMFYEEVIRPLKNNPDSRRIISSLWQIDDFKNPHGLKPCAFLTIWNVRHGWDNETYLDMTLIQRSSDFCTAGCINQTQYAALLLMVAREVGLTPGVFTWKPANVQIYDRHIDQAIELLNRESIDCKANLTLDEEVSNLSEITPDSIKVNDYPKNEIKEKNPQLKFQLGI